MLSKFEKDLLKIGFIFRIIIWAVSFISDTLIDDHDHSTELLLTKDSKQGLTWVSYLFKCFLRWDGLFYFGFIQSDYEYLKNHAFFPLYSKIIQYLKNIFLIPTHLFTDVDAIILTGIIFNLIIHLMNLVIFYRLSKVYLKNESLAKKSALLFMISPASVFFSAFYTESLFCFFTFLGYYFLYKDDPRSFKSVAFSTVFFTLSGFIRSNGNFYILLVGYQLLHRLIDLWKNRDTNIDKKIVGAVQIIGVGIIALIVMCIPYVIVMKKPYQTYCVDFQEYPHAEKPAFCQALLPNAYTYIQDKFWDVGFLTSWQPRKAFFVIWGVPMLVLMGILLVKYYKRNFLNTILLGLPNAHKAESENDAFYFSKNIPTIILTTVMFVVNAFFAHTNVSSRINSANPIVYWYAAYSMSIANGKKDGEAKGSKGGLSWKNHWIIYYFLFYVVTGCTVFTNFYLFV